MKKVLAMLVLCIASTGAFAQSAPAPMTGGSARMEHAMEQVQSRFAAANTSHDGKLTKEQAATGMPRVAQHFDQIDAQKVGYVTLPQIEQFMASQRKQ